MFFSVAPTKAEFVDYKSGSQLIVQVCKQNKFVKTSSTILHFSLTVHSYESPYFNSNYLCTFVHIIIHYTDICTLFKNMLMLRKKDKITER